MRAIFLISTISLLLGGPAYAADLGQYRPGNPYQSVIAPGADVCESHCAGDAQCRSWNYVKASPKASGVCEFNANDVAPVASAISISGSNMTAIYRPGVIQGGTNTIRVGTAPVSQNQPETQTATSRRIVREPVPQQTQIQTASTRRRTVSQTQAGNLTPQQNPYRQVTTSREGRAIPQGQSPQTGRALMPQSFKYDLGDRPSAPQTGQYQNQSQRQMPQSQSFSGQAYPPQNNPSATYQGQIQPAYAPQYLPAQPSPQQGSVTRTERRRQQGPSMPASNPRQQMASLAPSTPERAGQGQLNQGQAYQGQVYQGQVYQGQVYQSQNNQPQNYQNQGQAFPPQGNYQPQNNPSYESQNGTMPRRSATDPLTYGEVATAQMSGRQTPYAAANQAQSQMRPQPAYQGRVQGLSAEQAQQSLFGKLNDNVQVPNSGGAVPTNPNAPIPTMTSRASGRVEQSTLAGAPY